MAFTTRHTVLGRIRSGMELGWEEFAAIYEPLIRLRGRDRALAGAEIDDLVQNVLLEVYKGEAVMKFDPDRGCRFRDYLKTIIDRCAFKMRGKRQKRAVPLSDGADVVDPAAGPLHPR
jgi:DNA-directed RNA polymerase specialized sigma24 family protein